MATRTNEQFQLVRKVELSHRTSFPRIVSLLDDATTPTCLLELSLDNVYISPVLATKIEECLSQRYERGVSSMLILSKCSNRVDLVVLAAAKYSDRLIMDRTGLNRGLQEPIPSFIQSFSCRGCQLTSLSIFDHSFTSLDDAHALGNMLAANQSLTHLDLAGSNFDSSVFEVLIQGFHESTRLKSLNLSRCGLSDNQVTHLVEHLRQGSPLLRQLNLSSNFVEERASIALAALVLQKSNAHICLEYLDLNQCHGLNVQVLVEALKESRSLKHLGVADNPFSFQQLGALTELLTVPTLPLRSLRMNQVFPKALSEQREDIISLLSQIADAVRYNATIQVLDVVSIISDTRKKIVNDVILLSDPGIIRPLREILMYTTLNKSGIRALLSIGVSPLALWPHLLAKLEDRVRATIINDPYSSRVAGLLSGSGGIDTSALFHTFRAVGPALLLLQRSRDKL